MATRTLISICAVLWAASAALWQFAGKDSMPQTAEVSVEAIAVREEGGLLPAVIGKRDRALYRAIFSAQAAGDWKKADAAIARLESPLLMGHVLAERFASRHYLASQEELADWLNLYADLPQAESLAKAAGLAAPRRAVLSGYGDDRSGTMRFESAAQAERWQKGLHAWRQGDTAHAAALFAQLAEEESLSEGKRAAASYWAARAHDAAGHQETAGEYLRRAAAQPRNFYGILARKRINQPLALDRDPVALNEADVLEMIGDPACRRIIALAQVGMPHLAEGELRTAFLQSDEQEKLRLLGVARELGLAAVQIPMANRLSRDGQGFDFAKYPIPHWQPHEGFTIDPALIYALMRQESGFRSDARSAAGAEGLMQLMPQTADLMRQGLRDPSVMEVSAPVLNLTLGQRYVEHLLENPLVEGNLFYLLVAYNAGPGRLSEWKASLDYHNDPLLFVESIPFAETRSYVMQVMTNYWIYSELTGSPSRTVRAVINGHWPSYAQRSASAG